jgi:hypothetical protein
MVEGNEHRKIKKRIFLRITIRAHRIFFIIVVDVFLLGIVVKNI